MSRPSRPGGQKIGTILTTNRSGARVGADLRNATECQRLCVCWALDGDQTDPARDDICFCFRFFELRSSHLHELIGVNEYGAATAANAAF